MTSEVIRVGRTRGAVLSRPDKGGERRDLPLAPCPPEVTREDQPLKSLLPGLHGGPHLLPPGVPGSPGS